MSDLIDSDCVADYLKGGLLRNQIAISVITFGEVTEGITFGRDGQRHEQGFRHFLQIADMVPLSRATMRRFVRIRGALRA